MTFDSSVQWVYDSRLLLGPERRAKIDDLLRANEEMDVTPSEPDPTANGSLGILEGFASCIKPSGDQLQRTPLRSDCHGESAVVLALGWAVNRIERERRSAENLLDFIYFTSGMQGGVRGDPRHPSFGHVAWGIVSRPWEIANYGDDDARVVLSSMVASACLDSDRWNEGMLKSLLANLRTTGPLGFRGGRIDIGPLEALGWKHFHDAETIHYSPHYESYLWACFLWAYRQTGHQEFLDKAGNAIKMTMEVYPDGWVWKDNLERARMLLCLAWMVQLEDTEQHRDWVKRVAADLLEFQQPCGAIQERIVLSGAGHYVAPESNEAYGTREIPLIQQNGDPCTDQLYTTGFALLGLHEAVAATGDEDLRQAEQRLVEYLCRIQIDSKAFPYLSGTWFRAFDYERWECWASSGDHGWGAWSIESGWGQAWIPAVLALRQMKTSVWELTSKNTIAEKMETVQALMAQNDGSPWMKEEDKK